MWPLLVIVAIALVAYASKRGIVAGREGDRPQAWKWGAVILAALVLPFVGLILIWVIALQT